MFRDFEPIILGSRYELAFNVHPNVRANNVKQWVACVKGNPAKVPQAQRWVRNMNTPAPTSSTMPPQASTFGMSPHTAQPSTSANSKPE